MEVLLHVQRDEEPHREDRGVEKEDHRVRRSQRAQTEDAERHQRGGGEPALDEPEARQERDARGQWDENAGRAPAEDIGADDPVDERDHPGRHKERACQVEVAVAELAPALGDDATAERHDGDADRDVDEEDRGPPESLGQDAAEEDTGRRAQTAERAPDSERAVAGGALLERRGDDRQARGRDDGPAEPLDGTRDQEHGGRAGEGADERRGGEECCTGDEDSAAPEQIRRPAAQKQESRKGDRVGIDHPLEPGGGETEPVADRRQRDVHDRDVQDHHELRQADEQQQKIRVPVDVCP